MRRLLVLFLAAATMGVSGAAAQAPAAAQAVERDWTRVVSETPEGGFRMGNPDAPVRLVEYGSITCPHCAQFAAAATEAIEDRYVRTGRISFEFRPFLIFPSDPGIFQLMGCSGPASFFPQAAELYATQAVWARRIVDLPEAQLERMQDMTATARAAAMVRAAGLDSYFRSQGMSEQAIAGCLADGERLGRLADIAQHAMEEEGVEGTPTFLINGERVEAYDWEALEPQLRAAVGG
jgi:protein-disulfide isomerase